MFNNSFGNAELENYFTSNRIYWDLDADGSVSRVDYSSCSDADEAMERLQVLPSLKWISLQGSTITDRGLESIGSLSGLEQLDLRSCKLIGDRGMAAIGRLISLRKLELCDTSIGDLGLRHIGPLVNLEDLNLRTTCITDSGLDLLKHFSKLKRLELGGQFTDAALSYLAPHKELEWLVLSESKFTDEGLARIGQLSRLTHMYIQWTAINGMAFKHLDGLSSLQHLYARDSRFVDEALQYLKPYQKLATLSLGGTRVTDKGLKHLFGLKKLKNLDLEKTRVTKEGKNAVKEAIPKCVIIISADQGEIELDQFDEEYYWNHPPKCVSKFTLKPQRNEEATTYLVECSCGGQTGSVLGYPLQDFNPEYQGLEFVGPLGFRCSKCRTKTEIIDTQKHGYDGELGHSATLRGKGPRKQFHCANCQGDEFSVKVTFLYGGGELDLKADEPTVVVEDLFDSFSTIGKCLACQEMVQIASFECA